MKWKQNVDFLQLLVVKKITLLHQVQKSTKLVHQVDLKQQLHFKEEMIGEEMIMII